MENSAFFAEKGLTSTSAQHLCNLAKEYIQNLQMDMEAITFYKTSLKVIGSSEETVISYGTPETILQEIPNTLNKIAEAHSLIAWLKEAIKAKDEMLRELSHLTTEDYCKDILKQEIKAPEAKPALTEEEYYNSLPIKERNRYYSLEAKASVLGKFIHPDGAYSNSRKELNKKLLSPIKVEGNGRDTLVYTYTPTVSIDSVETMFFNLQKQYRECQAALNSMKNECLQAVQESQLKSISEYQQEQEAFSQTWKQICADFKEYKVTESKKISKLKIAIPDSLKRIYDEINGLGK